MDNVFNSILSFNLNEYYDLIGQFGSFCGGKTKKKTQKYKKIQKYKKTQKYKKETLKHITNIKRKKKQIQ